MMFKFILLLVVLFVAYGIVVWLLKRLTQTSQQIAELHSQLQRNDEILAAKIMELQKEKEAETALIEKKKPE
jgi:CHASE3 domain sensor protein